MDSVKYDVVVVTESRYVNEHYEEEYANNVALEDRLICQALEEIGLSAIKKSWNDPHFDWASTRFVLISSTWDYFHHYSKFMEWLKQVSEKAHFMNGYETLVWNIDKIYLKELHKNGVLIPPTHYVPPGSKKTLQKLLADLNLDHVVIKPNVGGGGRHTYLMTREETSQYEEVFSQVNENEWFMIQEYQTNITSKGEISLMYFNGEYSHAVLKRAKTGDFRVQDDFGGTVESHEAKPNELSFASMVLNTLDKMPVYARVDLIWDNKNRLALSELELIEPELWLRQKPASAKLLAKSVYNEIVLQSRLSNQ